MPTDLGILHSVLIAQLERQRNICEQIVQCKIGDNASGIFGVPGWQVHQIAASEDGLQECLKQFLLAPVAVNVAAAFANSDIPEGLVATEVLIASRDVAIGIADGLGDINVNSA